MIRQQNGSPPSKKAAADNGKIVGARLGLNVVGTGMLYLHKLHSFSSYFGTQFYTHVDVVIVALLT